MRAMFLGRFQPFHNGHLKVVQLALQKNEEITIVIGSAQASNTRENPFSAQERKQMIEKTLKGISNYRIFAVDDINCDDGYVRHVESIVPKCDVFYNGSERTKKLFRDAGYRIEDVDRFFNLSATEVRQRILQKGNWQSLVPKEVAEEIIKIKGLERIKACK